MSAAPLDESITPEMKQLIDGDLIRILSSGKPTVVRESRNRGVEYVLGEDTGGVMIPEGSITDEVISEPLVPLVVQMLNQLGFDDVAANTIIRRVGTAGPDRMQRQQW